MSSKISRATALLAPAFPVQGYLPGDLNEILAQRRRQLAEISVECMQARAKGEPALCAQVLNISLFFDGTNNHERTDSAANPPCSSNIARLFHATIQGREAMPSGYYSYYIQGVGTEFSEIGEAQPDAAGLKYASGGERRILWGMTRLIDALHISTGQQDGLSKPDALKLIKQMEYTKTIQRGERHVEEYRRATKAERVSAMRDALAPIEARLISYTPTVLRIKLFVYGFSRGAAEARAFVGRLAEVWGDGFLGKIPMSIEFLGLLDTVASVGVAAISGGSEGHMDWADHTMQLPADTQLLKAGACAHLVSAHEQRLCFPVDSVRRKDGSYPEAVIGEWVYPGVHSDVGGGYPPDDQGKAMGLQGLLLSQLALHHLYRLAFDAGAQLRLRKTESMPASKVAEIEAWRWMDKATELEFDLEGELKKRFSAWRKLAGGDAPLEEILQRQCAQHTAWRILRYAGGLAVAGQIQPNGQDQSQAAYYQNAKDDPEWLIDEKKDEWKRQSKSGATSEATLKNPKNPQQTAKYPPNIAKTYEPLRDQTQLRDAAADFRQAYLTRQTRTSFTGAVTSFILGPTRIFSDDCGQEYTMLKAAGERAYAELIKPENADVVALYDEHMHDSRAWFMYSTFAAREPGGSYFRYRTIFFSDGNTNKELICKAPDPVAAARPDPSLETSSSSYSAALQR